jgi:hypothetical protein
MRIRNRIVKQGADQQILYGVRTHLQTVPALYLGGKVYSPATLEARVQQRIDKSVAIVNASAALDQAIRDYEAEDSECDVIVRDLRRTVTAIFGDGSSKVSDFGFFAPQRPVWTPEMTTAAVAKRKATREARHTMGPKAKLAIKAAAPPPPTEPAPEPSTLTTTLTPKGDPRS